MVERRFRWFSRRYIDLAKQILSYQAQLKGVFLRKAFYPADLFPLKLCN